ncbi:DUF4349 domain-containing protein [Amycolatopsis cihanbeyliensis]|uniref:Uncharacterized protein DUF4349 n=1 Tax=Amycolatopsis cihanbeyliensis TaxID=1128664 RepID=A0A542DJU7_AMYCI|nr:DUF4349 domain-containing protein [Amycolatopsis cihanbeyliensis]TQJ03369.1 uncharacterized protein DUF4349 [Amycolatopsis cihanbeyliensis]
MRARAKPSAMMLVVLGMTVGLLSGCTGERDAAAPHRASAGAGDARAESGNAADAPAAQGGEGDRGGGATVRIDGADRKLARTARLELTAADVSATVRRARQVATGAGGYTGQERVDGHSASVEVVVPSDQLDAVLGELTSLGEVVRRQQRTEDVTEQVVDVESRLASQRASVQRVRALLERASSISEITSVESELTERQSELESLQARQEALAGRVATATVSLSVSRSAVAAEQDEDGVLGGLAAGWRAFTGFLGDALTVLAAALPFLAFFGLPAAAGAWQLFRRRRRRVVGEPVPE